MRAKPNRTTTPPQVTCSDPIQVGPGSRPPFGFDPVAASSASRKAKGRKKAAKKKPAPKGAVVKKEDAGAVVARILGMAQRPLSSQEVAARATQVFKQYLSPQLAGYHLTAMAKAGKASRRGTAYVLVGGRAAKA